MYSKSDVNSYNRRDRMKAWVSDRISSPIASATMARRWKKTRRTGVVKVQRKTGIRAKTG
jgi:hypothetical protein